MDEGIRKQNKKLIDFLENAKSNLHTKIMDKEMDQNDKTKIVVTRSISTSLTHHWVVKSKADKVKKALDEKIGPMTTEDLVQVTMKMMIGDQKSLESVVARLRAFPIELCNPVWNNTDDPQSLLLEQCN